MPLKIYNSMIRRKEDFVPLSEGQVGMYVCGPTVYGHCHVGHAKSYISFDVILRYLRYLGYKVRYVQNITDVGHLTEDDVGMADEGEDKILRQARQERLEPMELVETYTWSYFEDMDRLYDRNHKPCFLFDRKADPDEENDLAEDKPDVVALLADLERVDWDSSFAGDKGTYSVSQEIHLDIQV